MTLLTVREIERSFGSGAARLQVLKGVDLTMKRGEVVALMGPSGCGKSTLLNIIGGLLEADAGGVTLATSGEVFDYGLTHPRHLAELRRRGVGWIFQDFNLFDHMTVLDNVLFALELAGTYGAAAENAAHDSLARVGLADRGASRPGELSGGQAQRVAVARAIAGRRQLLLADEPTGNLDVRTGQEILKTFRELSRHADNPVSILMVTHDPNIARRADRMLLLRDGRLRESTVEESWGAAAGRRREAPEAAA